MPRVTQKVGGRAETGPLSEKMLGFRKRNRIRDQIANIHWIIEKAREFQETIYV